MRKILYCLLLAAAFIGPIFAEEIYFDLNKKSYTYDELIKPEKTVFFIWAGWCNSCRKELIRIFKDPEMMQGINVVYLDYGEPSGEVKHALDILGASDDVRKKVILDPLENIGNRFFLAGVPTVIFFKNGVPVRTAHDLSRELIYYVYPQEDKPVQPAGKVFTSSERRSQGKIITGEQ